MYPESAKYFARHRGTEREERERERQRQRKRSVIL